MQPVFRVDQHMNSKDISWNCDKLVWPTTGLHFEEGYFCLVVGFFLNEKARATIKNKVYLGATQYATNTVVPPQIKVM